MDKVWANHFWNRFWSFVSWVPTLSRPLRIPWSKQLCGDLKCKRVIGVLLPEGFNELICTCRQRKRNLMRSTNDGQMKERCLLPQLFLFVGRRAMEPQLRAVTAVEDGCRRAWQKRKWSSGPSARPGQAMAWSTPLPKVHPRRQGPHPAPGKPAVMHRQ